MTPRFLTLEIGRMVVSFTEMAKIGCEKADSGRWKQSKSFSLGIQRNVKEAVKCRVWSSAEVSVGRIHRGAISSLKVFKALGIDECVV